MQEKGNGVMISLEGKNAIVTGGGGGMGRCTALTPGRRRRESAGFRRKR